MEIEIIYSKRRSMALQVKNGRVIVRAPIGTSKSRITDFVEGNRRWITAALAKSRMAEANAKADGLLSESDVDALKQKAKDVIPQRVAHFAPIVGVNPNNITIRAQRTKWGSCSSKGNLNFNCLLMLMPEYVMDSIVVHELCHMLEMNHSNRFYREVYRVFPQYDKAHAWLRENGSTLMRRLPQ